MSPLPALAGHVLGGEERAEGGDRHDVVSPFTEEAVGASREAGAALVDEAVRRARAAHERWTRVDPAGRAELLETLADLLERDGDAVAGTVSTEMGMPLWLAAATQVDLPTRVLRSTAALTRTLAWVQTSDGAVLHRRGAGVVGAITPWNMPVHQIVAKVAAALGAGCAVVLKPSEQTPYDAVRLALLVAEAAATHGAPADLLQVVQGTGPVTGAALTQHPGLDRLTFTGSVAAGRLVAAAGAATLTPATLELGGKSPALVLPDADLAEVVPAVLASGLVNSGQACNATTRLLFPAAVLPEVEEVVRAEVGRFVLGDPADPATRQGPLVTRAHRDRVLGHVAGALADGGRLVTGTGRPSEAVGRGWFVDPVVLADLPAGAAAVQQEIFGPVLVLQGYDDLDHAISLANDTRYGLSAEVWSAGTDGSRATAVAVAAEIRAGQVKVDGVRTRERPAVPFGGSGDSGWGRELGTHGLLEMTELTAVMA